jgi:hypothetical protein
MPIRINLLAEAQAVEEQRRKDPIKRVLWVAASLVACMLVWSSYLQLEVMSCNGRLSHVQGTYDSHTNQLATVKSHKKKLSDTQEKLAALDHLVTNRFLYANVLNALMRTTVPGVQIVRLRLDQGYTTAPGTPASNTGGHLVPAKPGASTERTTLMLDAKDGSSNPGDEAIDRFRSSIAHNDFFVGFHLSTNNIFLKNLSTPQVDPDSGASFVLFTLECHFPDQVRTP